MDPAISRFVERFGHAVEAEGLPRIAGRLMAYLIVVSGPHTFDELVDVLQVSRGSISTNTRLLEFLGIAERVTRPGDRRDYYQVTADPYGRLVQGQLDRMRQLAAIVADARAELPASLAESKRRLGALGRFYDFAGRETEKFLAGWMKARDV